MISDECKDELAQPSWAEGVPAPVDADGKLVPLSTGMMFAHDGNPFSVCYLAYAQDENHWIAYGHHERPTGRHYYSLLDLHLTRPDSWERLEEDLTRAVKGEEFYSMACAYANNRSNECGDCKLRGSCGRCTKGMLEDIESRVRKLREEDDD